MFCSRDTNTSQNEATLPQRQQSMHPNNARVSVHPTGMGSGHRYYPDELNLGRLVSLDQPTQRSVLIIRLISLTFDRILQAGGFHIATQQPASDVVGCYPVVSLSQTAQKGVCSPQD